MPLPAPRPSRRARHAGPLLAALCVLAVGSAPAGDLSFGGTMFANLSQLETTRYASDTRTHDTAADLKRFYIDVDWRLDEAWSVHLTTDVNWLRHDDPSDVWVRHFYAERRFQRGGQLRLGVDDMPWMALNNKWYGLRYLGPVGATRAGIENVADWGAHLNKRIAPGVDLAVSVVTGSSFKRPTTGRRADVEAYLAWHPVGQAIIAVGGYDGQRAQDRTAWEPLRHTARRWDVMAAWASDAFRLGARWSRAENWADLHAPEREQARNLAAWISGRIAPQWSLFAYADRTEPTRRADAQRRTRSLDAGVQWQPHPRVRVALAGKQATARAASGRLTRAREYGVWSQWTW